jgi:hypothetical protein
MLRLEQEMRTLAAGGATGTLSALWTKAAGRLAKGTDRADKSLEDSLRRARAAVKADGELADCDAAMPARLLRHAWSAVQKQKTEGFRKDLDRLVLKLSDILKADYERSEAGRSAKHLKAAVGSGFGDAFDFDAMSRILSKAGGGAYASCSRCSARSNSFPPPTQLRKRPPRPSPTRSCSRVAPTRWPRSASACPS